MASIKVKFRPSSIDDREGTLFFQIIHLRQVRQIYTGLRIRDDEWVAMASAVVSTSSADSLRKTYLSSVRASLGEGINKIESIIMRFDGEGSPYTAGDIVTEFNTPLVVVGVVSFIRKLIGDMNKIGKKPAVKRLKSSLTSLLRYTRGHEVAWPDFTSTFVLGYEEFLSRRGLCRNSTSFYMRNLRSILNRAEEMDFKVRGNPFSHVYMGIDKTVKRAVPLDTVRRIRDLDLSTQPTLDFARNVFMFAFYTRGMSFVDIAFLKKSDICGGVLTYSRRKTRRQLQVRIEPETRKIIECFGENGSSYLLPIISDGGGDLEQQYESAYYRVNRDIQKIGRILGLETKLTLYVARHAWASIAHANHVPLSTISKAMGHDSENTTLIYLQSLDSSSVDKANSDIIKMMDKKRKR